MSTSSTITTFDVAGTITFNDVKRPATHESPEARIVRLAEKAVIEGVQLHGDVQAGLVSASSARVPGLLYWVNLRERTCSCAGFTHTGMCKHLAYGLMERLMTFRRAPITPDVA